MRIAFCLTGPNDVNGPNAWLVRHLPLLRCYGAQPEVVYLSHQPDRPCAYRDALAADGFRIRTVKLERFTEESVANIVHALDPDLPDVFVPNHSVPAYYAARFLRDAGVKTIGVLHSDDPYYDDIADVFVAGADTWRLSGVVAVSEYLARRAVDMQPDQIAVAYAPCGAPIPRVPCRRDGPTLRIVYVGRLVEYQKRITRVAHRLCDAAAMFPDVEAILYGDGEARDAVDQILAERSPDGRVRLGGCLSPSDVPAALQNAHAIVLLSDFEGLSMSLLEAMAAGLVPIVSRLRSGAAELVRNGENGLVIDGDDERVFADAVRLLTFDAERWETMSANARQTISDGGFTSEVCAERWMAFCSLLPTPLRRRRPGALPLSGTWGLPARSHRARGIEPHDRRLVDRQVEFAVRDARPVYLWGAGAAGRVLLGSRPGWRGYLEAAIDSNEERQGTTWEAMPVVAPTILESPSAERPFVIIASQSHSAIERELERRGFRPGLDFVAA